MQRTQRNRRGNPPPPKRPKARPLKKQPKKQHDYDKRLYPNLPHFEIRDNVIFIMDKKEDRKFKIPWLLIFTIIIIFAGAIGSAYASARISTTELDIAAARDRRLALQNTNITMQELVSDQYTNEQIEQFAIENLGMSFPDPSQIHEIYVPRHSYVVLNTAYYALPAPNYFWEDIVEIISGFLSRVFGG